jgi:tRNA(Ile)-lysidine synthase
MFKSPATKASTGPLPLPGLQLPERGQKVLVAVSGGLDSMVLLHALHAPAAGQGWKLAVAHFNHRLRGRASDADEACVAKTAAALKLPFYAAEADVKGVAAKERISVEMAARRLRHEFLARTARLHGIHTIAVAHHADDQVELFFLRLLRGAGGTGLGGMQWRSPSPADERIFLVRPLLEVSKAVLEEFARENRIRYREDTTNRVHDFLRNRIRHELLPLLRKKYQPGLNKTVLRSMEIAGAESGLIAELAHAWLNRQPFWGAREKKAGSGSGFVQAEFEKLPPAIQRQILVAQTIQLGVTPDFELIESMRLSSHKPVAVNAHMSLSRDVLGKVSQRPLRTATFNETRLVVKLDRPGQTLFDRLKLKWKTGPRRMDNVPGPQAGTEFFDADKLGEEILLRFWKAGDRFQPIGLKSKAKLQDLFTNAKIPRAKRHGLIVGEAAGGIFWVEGLRISETFKITGQTKRVLTWNWQR